MRNTYIKVFVLVFLFNLTTKNFIAQNENKLIDQMFDSYTQEIKSTFETHYNRKFELDSSMNTACIDHVERLIDEKPSKTYKACNFFVTRRFEKSVFQDSEYVTKKDILFADWRLEFVENNLNDPRFNYVNADKLHVAYGEHEEYVYVVVGVTSSWYKRNPDLWVYENDD